MNSNLNKYNRKLDKLNFGKLYNRHGLSWNNPNKFNWEGILKTPLTLSIARQKAPSAAPANLANQNLTALHEAIHLIYAAWCGIYVNFVAVSTHKSGSVYSRGHRVQGTTLAYDYNEGYPAIYSTCAAAVFEMVLNDIKTNVLIETELEVAYNAAKHLRYPDPYDHKDTQEILEGILDHFTCNKTSVEDGPLGSLWWLIRSVAIAILLSRRSSDGQVSNKDTQLIYQYAQKYCRPDGEGEYFPDWRMRVTMTQDIERLKIALTC